MRKLLSLAASIAILASSTTPAIAGTASQYTNSDGSVSRSDYTLLPPSGLTPVSVSFTAGSQASGAFTPFPGKGIWVNCQGSFVATITVKRSTDGVNWYGLTAAGSAYAVFTGPAQEVVSSEDEPGAQYRLEDTSYSSGTANCTIGNH